MYERRIEGSKKYKRCITYFELKESYFLEEKEYGNDLSIIVKELKDIKENRSKREDCNYSYIIDADEYEGDFPDIETVKLLVVSDQVGTGGTSFVMDFEKNIIYDSYYGANVYTDVRYADKKIDLTEDKKSEIIQALKDAKIWEWDYMYSNHTEVGMESWWHMGIEFEDGTVVSYNGAGMVPDNYKPLEEVLFER